MRLTNPLRAQHFGFAFKKKWYAHGKMTIPETSAREILEARGIQVADPKKVVDDRPILKMYTKSQFLLNIFSYVHNLNSLGRRSLDICRKR